MKKLVALLMLIMSVSFANAEEIGSVSTTFRLLGANNKIVIDAFDDPDVSGVTCYVSHAKTGGIKGSIGIAEDSSDASIACRQVGAIDETKLGKLKDGEQVFKQNTSLFFKTMQVVRFYDKKRNVLTYLNYSDKIIQGSPKNSISVVAVNR